VRLAGCERRLLALRPPANAIQARTAEPLLGAHGHFEMDYSGGPWFHFAWNSPNAMSARHSHHCLSSDAPRRAEIRRRGKRGRIGRAGAIEAYENRTQLTNDALKRPSDQRRRGRNGECNLTL
jgi:hypothetical protein